MRIFDNLYLFTVTMFYPAAMMLAAGQPAGPEQVLQERVAPVYGAVAGSAEAEAESAEIKEQPPIAQPAQPPTLEDVMQELADLRAQVLRMEQSMESWFGASVTELKAENETLRRELRQVYSEAGKSAPQVPTPEKTLIDQVLQEADPAVEAASETTPQAPVDPEVAKAVAENGFLAIAEWGREPADAAQVDPPRASLKGLIAVVAPGTAQEDLEALGRKLRTDYDGYDNINVEIFDDKEAAANFKSGLPMDEKRHVLSVSRHKASQRDVILLLTGEKPVEVPRNPQTVPTE